MTTARAAPGWRQFRWVRRWTGAEISALDLDAATERLAADSRARRLTRMDGRDRLVTSLVASAFVAVAATLPLLVPSHRPLDLVAGAVLVVLFALASRLDFEVGSGSAVPTTLVLVPMLFLLPLGQVPLWVAAGYMLGGAPDYLRRRQHVERSLVLVCSSWHAVGPTLVLFAFGERTPRLSDAPVYLAALGAQFVFDAVSACGRDRVVRRVPLRDLARYLGWAYLVDLLLAPIGLALAIAASGGVSLGLIALPLLALVALFARERRARVDHALELSAAYSGTGRLAETYHEILGEETLGSTLERIADTLTELIECDYVAFSLTDAPGREPVVARGHTIVGATVFAAPLVARGTEWGTLTLERVADRPFGTDEQRLASWFGDAAALALDGLSLRETLTLQAQTDSLTGLLNHRTFQERLAAELLAGRERNQPVALLMLDIDNFKRVNDVHGHDVGDSVLETLAATLRAIARAGDHVCRVGGEELAIVMPSTDTEGARVLGARLQELLSTHRVEPVGVITVSIGIAESPAHAQSGRELIARAEQAMMTAKVRGKNATVVYEAVAMTRPGDEVAERRDRTQRTIAHLRMLQGLIGKVHRLHDEGEIADTITRELRRLIEHDTCRLYRREDVDAVPEAVRAAGDLRSVLTLDHERSSAAVPLLVGDGAIAVLVLERRGGSPLDVDDVQLLELLASHAAVAIENASLYVSVRSENERLERDYRAAIDALGNALLACDQETGEHADETSRLALELGRALGLGPEALERLELGALLHDIGKIGIPSRILTKPGPLTTEERAIIECHPEVGERILAPVERLAGIRPIVRHSHERWDGNGYPDRLAGVEIPLEARIVAVADAYSAMTTDRPYRLRLTDEQARRELRSNSGSQFDPDIVDAFLELLGLRDFGADELVA